MQKDVRKTLTKLNSDSEVQANYIPAMVCVKDAGKEWLYYSGHSHSELMFR